MVIETGSFKNARNKLGIAPEKEKAAQAGRLKRGYIAARLRASIFAGLAVTAARRTVGKAAPKWHRST